MHDRRARPDAIGYRQCAAPIGGRDAAAERVEQHLGVGVGDGKYGNLQDRRGCGDRKPLGVAGRTDARGQRVAGIQRHVGDGAALYAMRRPHRTGGIRRVDPIAVLRRVGIDNAADGTVFCCHFRFNATP